MSRWYLKVLGIPQLKALSQEHSPEPRFRYRDTWLLLASLALEPQINRREVLIHRLALDDQQTGKEKLRLRLHDLRKGAAPRKSHQSFCGIGAANLLIAGESIALAPEAVRTDLQELEEILDEARLLSTPAERIACLKRGAALLLGPLLDGFDASLFPGHWLETLRFRADCLAADLWLQLATALDANGERRSAFDAARKAYTLSPENPETLELLLGLAEGTREHDEVLQLSKQLGVEGLFSRLEDLEKEGQALTVSEEHALQEAVQLRLTQLSQSATSGLKRIACFPQDFNAEQASAICDVSVETLERLVRAFPLRKVGERYYLLPALCNALRSLLPESEVTLFEQRHADYFARRIDTDLPFDTESFRQELICEEKHFLAILLRLQSRPPSAQSVLFMHFCWHWLGKRPPIRESLVQAERFLESAVDLIPESDAWVAAELLGHMMMAKQNYKAAVKWFELTHERFHTLDPSNWIMILISSHHAAEDEIFDRYAEKLLNHLPIQHLSHEGKSRFLEWAQVQVAENSAARRDFTKALEHNTAAFSLRKSLGHLEDFAPSLWGQRAAILSGLGRMEECEQCWDRALKGYEVQGNLGGVAECYQEIGRLAAKKGQGGLGISLLRQAIVHFGEQGNLGAVAAAQGTLGDIWLDLGEHVKAHEFYEQGMAYWQAQNHPRWIQRFQQRLKSFPE